MRTKLNLSCSLFSMSAWLLLHNLSVATAAFSADTITVADASLSLAHYADGSCLLTVDDVVQVGKTIIDVDVDDQGSRMFLHCDTEDGRRLTLLARGDVLNVAQREDLLSREQIAKGEFGMIAWLTRSGVNYTDDSAPRRYVIAGGVKLSKSPSAEIIGNPLHSQGVAFATINGLLEPILKADEQNEVTPIPETDDQANGQMRAQKPAAQLSR